MHVWDIPYHQNLRNKEMELYKRTIHDPYKSDTYNYEMYLPHNIVGGSLSEEVKQKMNSPEAQQLLKKLSAKFHNKINESHNMKGGNIIKNIKNAALTIYRNGKKFIKWTNKYIDYETLFQVIKEMVEEDDFLKLCLMLGFVEAVTAFLIFLGLPGTIVGNVAVAMYLAKKAFEKYQEKKGDKNINQSINDKLDSINDKLNNKDKVQSIEYDDDDFDEDEDDLFSGRGFNRFENRSLKTVQNFKNSHQKDLEYLNDRFDRFANKEIKRTGGNLDFNKRANITRSQIENIKKQIPSYVYREVGTLLQEYGVNVHYPDFVGGSIYSTVKKVVQNISDKVRNVINSVENAFSSIINKFPFIKNIIHMISSSKFGQICKSIGERLKPVAVPLSILICIVIILLVFLSLPEDAVLGALGDLLYNVLYYFHYASLVVFGFGIQNDDNMIENVGTVNDSPDDHQNLNKDIELLKNLKNKKTFESIKNQIPDEVYLKVNEFLKQHGFETVLPDHLQHLQGSGIISNIRKKIMNKLKDVKYFEKIKSFFSSKNLLLFLHITRDMLKVAISILVVSAFVLLCITFGPEVAFLSTMMAMMLATVGAQTLGGGKINTYSNRSVGIYGGRSPSNRVGGAKKRIQPSTSNNNTNLRTRRIMKIKQIMGSENISMIEASKYIKNKKIPY